MILISYINIDIISNTKDYKDNRYNIKIIINKDNNGMYETAKSLEITKVELHSCFIY